MEDPATGSYRSHHTRRAYRQALINNNDDDDEGSFGEGGHVPPILEY